ncbi:MAG: hypothetical protein AAGE59_37505 [Cyanobacteria bacterium P01_F01_bin.86]
MFFDELTPVFEAFTRQPVAFLGGVVAGALRLNLNEDPVKSWLAEQNITMPGSDDDASNSDANGPQKISID